MSESTERYAIRVAGHLAGRWAARFEGMTLTAHDDGTTVIAGPVPDQSALHAVLRTLADLGLPLISVLATEDTTPDTTTSHTTR